MRTAILSDVHGNLDALNAVLKDMGGRSVDDLVCLGDCVGYGAQPATCLERLHEVAAVVLAGNHDRTAAGLLNTRRFNTLARSAIDDGAAKAKLEALVQFTQENALE